MPLGRCNVSRGGFTVLYFLNQSAHIDLEFHISPFVVSDVKSF